MRQRQLLTRLPVLLNTSRAFQSGMQALGSHGPWTERQLASQAASTSGRSNSGYWPIAALPVLGLVAVGAASADPNNSPQDEGFHLLPLPTRQRIFFKYEKRIRDKSTLDKVFEYFSSLEKDKFKYMTPADMLRAVVPTYPPSESTVDRSGYLDGERTSAALQPSWSKDQTSFFKQFDVDGDGVISFPEFLLVLTLLSIRDVKTIFDVVDLDGNGYIDFAEFKLVMELLQAKANVHTSRVGRSHKLSLDAESSIMVSFFGRDSKKPLHLPQFRDFLTRLQQEVVRLEFAHYDVQGRGSMPALDFAHSLVATADVRHVDKLLDKADAMGAELLRQRISFEDFLKVHQVQRGLHTLTVALDFFQQLERPVLKADFAKLLKKLLDVSLPDHVVDIMFAVFCDERGALDTPTFLEVMQRREIMWARRNHTDLDTSGPVNGGLACIKKCMRGE